MDIICDAEKLHHANNLPIVISFKGAPKLKKQFSKGFMQEGHIQCSISVFLINKLSQDHFSYTFSILSRCRIKGILPYAALAIKAGKASSNTCQP